MKSIKKIKVTLFFAMYLLLNNSLTAQVSFQITDGSKYLTGNANAEVYYLYITGGTNGTYGSPATCQMWACYITVKNKTNRKITFFANVSVGISNGNNCRGFDAHPISGTIAPNSALKVRVMPDFWTDLNASPGSPGFAFTDFKIDQPPSNTNPYSQSPNSGPDGSWIKLPDHTYYKILPSGMYSFFDGIDQIETVPKQDGEKMLLQHGGKPDRGRPAASQHKSNKNADEVAELDKIYNQLKAQIKELKSMGSDGPEMAELEKQLNELLKQIEELKKEED